jgi:hypothetical protein
MLSNKIPSLINGSAGRPTLKTAGKKCDCVGCGGGIIKGEKCFDIPNPRTSFSNPRRFCVECFRQVLAKTKADLVEFEQEVQFNKGTLAEP